MKPTIEIIEAYTNNLSDFTFKELPTDKGDQYSFCTGNHHHSIKNHLKNVNCLIAPDVCVITETMEWGGDDRWEMTYFFEVIDPLKIRLNELRDLIGMSRI